MHVQNRAPQIHKMQATSIMFCNTALQSRIKIKNGGDTDVSPTDESPNEKSPMFRPLDNASLYLDAFLPGRGTYYLVHKYMVHETFVGIWLASRLEGRGGRGIRRGAESVYDPCVTAK